MTFFLCFTSKKYNISMFFTPFLFLNRQNTFIDVCIIKSSFIVVKNTKAVIIKTFWAFRGG